MKWFQPIQFWSEGLNSCLHLAHNKRMEDVCFPKTVFFGELLEGKCDHSAPRKCYKDQLKRQLAQAGISHQSWQQEISDWHSWHSWVRKAKQKFEAERHEATKERHRKQKEQAAPQLFLAQIFIYPKWSSVCVCIENQTLQWPASMLQELTSFPQILVCEESVSQPSTPGPLPCVDRMGLWGMKLKTRLRSSSECVLLWCPCILYEALALLAPQSSTQQETLQQTAQHTAITNPMARPVEQALWLVLPGLQMKAIILRILWDMVSLDVCCFLDKCFAFSTIVFPH